MSFSTSVHQPNVDQNNDAVPKNPKDNYWDSATCQNAIEIVDRRCTALIYKKDGKGFCSALAKHPILLNKNCSGICYFEILIVNMKSMVTIGFAPKQFTISQSDERIFNCADTYAYESGGNFWINGRGQRGKSEFTFQAGDIVGCGINLDTRQIFFTQNKWDFGDIAFLSMCPSVVPLFPFVSLMDSGDKIVAKFKPKFIINLASLKFNPVERQQNSGTIPNEVEAVIDGEHTPLWTAVVGDQRKLHEILLENGADPNENLKLAYKGQNRSNLETFKVLMENGANVKQKTADDFGSMPLHFACSEGHLEIVKLLVEEGEADIEIADSYGKTALMVACSLQKWDIVRYLIGKGAKVDRTNAKGISPLHLECIDGHLEIVKLLVEGGKADIEKAEADSVIEWSPLMVASLTEKWDIVRYLIEKGANIDQTNSYEGFSIIHFFAIHGHFDLCKLMLDKGINVNKQMHNRTTPLHLACKHGHLEIVKLLVEEGKADIESADDNRHTPLMIALCGHQLEIAYYLVEKGAKVDQSADFIGNTPFLYAIYMKSLSLCKLMVKVANVNLRMADHGFTPLRLACEVGHLGIVKLLVEEGKADIEIADSYGKTALMVACSLQKWDIVRYLIGKGAKVDRTNAKVKLLVEGGKADIEKAEADSVIEWSPLMVASLTEKWDIVRYLIEKGANIDQTNSYEGFSIIHFFAIHGHFDLCKLMLDKGINVNKQMHNRTTPLHLACKHGHLEIVKLLVEEGKADIESADDNRHTPLMIALCGHQLEIAYYLVEKGAKVDQSADFIGNTPFLYAIYMKSLSLCKLMVKVANVNLRMADHGFTPLRLACEVGHLGIVKLLVEEGKADIEIADSYGKTALMVACSLQKCDIVRYLIGKGAKVDRTNAKGISPLLSACIDGHLEIVKLLVEGGKADIEIEADSVIEWSPLMVASKKRKWDIVRYLIEKGVKVDQTNAKGISPLHLACIDGHLEIVKLLVEVGKADIEKAEADSVIGWSPLMVASNIQKWDIFRYLIEKGANIDHTDNNGLSIIHYLVDNNNFDECKILIDKGVNVNQKTADNLLRSTPLHLACKTGQLEIVKLLVEEGKADIEIANSDGDTALKLAKAKKKDDVVHYLVEKGAKNN
ncbi:hypothetical protein niasHT_038811 [Heterodera trifolii]|uniref:B30.2/SPRY domain-containing protein n=1 Tax=Heterodera trifolii TaxID=157864 RepID=A0ABD2IG10_9BILA